MGIYLCTCKGEAQVQQGFKKAKASLDMNMSDIKRGKFIDRRGTVIK